MFAESAQQSPDVVWRLINDVLGRGKRDSAPAKITVDNVELAGKELADHLNNHFVNVGISAHMPLQAEFFRATTGNKCPDSIFLAPTDEQEIYTTFMNLKNSKALDIDNIQIKPIKYVLDCITPALSHIFNLILESGVFPDDMKRGRVTVFFKGGDSDLVTNYRPISIIPVFSKGLEKLIYTRISAFFCSRNIITDFQFGFRKGRSTETALLTLKEMILQNFERNLFTLAVFLDFSKAFDCINHTILLLKLESYGIRGTSLQLIKSYLQNRQQCVQLSSHTSSYLPVLNGVPQGSVLGPLLFNAYINDIVDIDPSVSFVIYADDTNLLFSGPDANELIIRCNKLLNKLFLWSSKNLLKINPLKTKAIVFRAKNKIFSSTQALAYAGEDILFVDEHKILGVTFSSNLSWNQHVVDICKKASSVVGVLARCRHILPAKVKLQIYNALFLSHINYCSLVWATTTKTNIMKLQTMQKKVIRHVANLDYLASTQLVCRDYGIIKVEYMYIFRILRSCYFSSISFKQFIKNTACLTAKNVFLGTRSNDVWFVPRFRNNYKSQTLQYNLPNILNKYSHVNSFSLKELRSFFVNTG